VFEWGMEKRKHYWNGRWGHIARHDLLLYEDGGQWIVEHRVGGTEGRSFWTEYDAEEPAVDRLRDLLCTDDQWRQLV
jgi:hypothetical protein